MQTSEQLETSQMMKCPQSEVLNLGCGRKRATDAVNVDSVIDVRPDVLHDLNCLPWPFPDDHFREVLAYDVIEHLENVVAVLQEIHRICKHGALVRITVPHFSSANAYSDPTHRHFFSQSSFDFLTEGHELSFYTKDRFKRLVANILFYPTVINKLIRRLANRYPAAYEQRWSWIFPAWFLYFELEVLKESQADF